MFSHVDVTYYKLHDIVSLPDEEIFLTNGGIHFFNEDMVNSEDDEYVQDY